MLKIAVTADLHWGVRPNGDAATLKLVEHLKASPPDVLILAGDVGAGDEFEACLRLFDDLPSVKTLVPGNHDIWVASDDRRGDSWSVYQEWLPRHCREHGFHYLDHSPRIFPAHDLALLGTINWYDGSWAAASDEWSPPKDFDERFREMRFTRGRHYDVRFVRWHHTPESFTRWSVERLSQHLEQALAVVSRAIIVTHHPAFRGLNVPLHGPLTVDRLLWQAFAGNESLEQLLECYQNRVAVVFSGHTHLARETRFGSIVGYNIGGDYDWKRLLVLDWPGTSVTSYEFRGEDGSNNLDR